MTTDNNVDHSALGDRLWKGVEYLHGSAGRVCTVLSASAIRFPSILEMLLTLWSPNQHLVLPNQIWHSIGIESTKY